jgi:hypothetical protein
MARLNVAIGTYAKCYIKPLVAAQHPLWSEHITTRRSHSVSPYFMVTGAHPIIPLDVVEANWLVEYPGRTLSPEELVGYRARALFKHCSDIEHLHQKVDKEKRD